jgi:hypothetical protein
MFIRDAVALKTRMYFSIQHIQSAALFARKGAEVERYTSAPTPAT